MQQELIDMLLVGPDSQRLDTPTVGLKIKHGLCTSSCSGCLELWIVSWSFSLGSCLDSAPRRMTSGIQ